MKQPPSKPPLLRVLADDVRVCHAVGASDLEDRVLGRRVERRQQVVQEILDRITFDLLPRPSLFAAYVPPEVDAVVFTSNKCLECVPGLGFAVARIDRLGE